MPEVDAALRAAVRAACVVFGASICVFASVRAGAESPPLPAPATAGADRSTGFVARRYFPDETEADLSAQGEVRVSRLPGGLRIRTLIYTRLLKRVVAELADKIESGWPQSGPYHDDAMRYVSAVESARDEIWSRWRLLSTRERVERRQNLVIDFELDAATAVIRLAIPELAAAHGDLRVVALEPLPGPSLSEAFVRGEAVRILRDRFPDRADELINALERPAGR